MTPNTLKSTIQATNRDRRWLARQLGYRSESSLRQAEDGRQTLSIDKLTWLEGYAELRSKLEEVESKWMEKNPPPAAKRS